MAGEIEIGAFEAKTKLPELLRGTAEGRSYVITRRGKPVARLIPARESEKTYLLSILAELNAIRSRVEGPVDIRSLIEEGRRY
ncbi:MAG TPA: type II toxin-antitoxin system prevent-host-death family antitoxin [Polyangia bacterium]|nr:type II toxin-antitoxin system prevent-host-death family antitoxin [Polyangia bacterium]